MEDTGPCNLQLPEPVYLCLCLPLASNTLTSRFFSFVLFFEDTQEHLGDLPCWFFRAMPEKLNNMSETHHLFMWRWKQQLCTRFLQMSLSAHLTQRETWIQLIFTFWNQIMRPHWSFPRLTDLQYFLQSPVTLLALLKRPEGLLARCQQPQTLQASPAAYLVFLGFSQRLSFNVK